MTTSLVDNAEFAEDNYNTIDTFGARAALRVNLGENWTITPQLMYQKMEQEGSWGDDLNDCISCADGKDKVAHFRDEFADDEWYQAGLTIEGSIGNFDVVYSGNYLNRDDEGSSDYSDYSYFYDSLSHRCRLLSPTCSSTTPAITLNPGACLHERRSLQQDEPRAPGQHAAGQARARPARLLLPEAVSRLLPGVRQRRGPRRLQADELRWSPAPSNSRASCT